MKKLAVIVGLALLMSVPAWAGGIGVGIATWDTEQADSDEGFTIRLGMDVGENFDFEVRASFFDEFAQVASGALFRLEATPVDLGLAWHFNENGKAQPYLGLGGSFVFADAQFEGGLRPFAGGPEVDDEFGYYAVVGLDAAVGERLGFFAEAMYRSAKLEVTFNDFGSADFQSDFAGPAGALGLMLTW
ncbi:MAG: outer membrane beta-barrel protein [Thermoanaerobaculia bacterium]